MLANKVKRNLKKNCKKSYQIIFSQLLCNDYLNQFRIEKKNVRELRHECKCYNDDEEKRMSKKDVEDSGKILNTLKTNLGF